MKSKFIISNDTGPAMLVSLTDKPLIWIVNDNNISLSNKPIGKNVYKVSANSIKNISVEQMNDVLSSTEFIPCPYGFFHPETYRVFEALECGSIPIVESAYDYYDKVFPNNPFIKINKWKDAKPILLGWDKEQTIKKSEECINWWNKQKDDLQNFVKDKIRP